MPATPRPPLIIPSEIQVREFDPKLLMACLAAERGYRAIIGERVRIHNGILGLPKGIYVAKDVARTSEKIFGILSRLGFPIVAWDEEAIVYYSTELYIRQRACRGAVSKLRRYFAWGETQKADLSTVPEFAGVPIEATGNPRTDLLRPELRGFYESDVRKLHERYGSFILINTNFGRLNHFLPERRLTPSAPGPLALRNLREGDVPLEIWAFREKVFKQFQVMLPAVARAFPDRRVILRPHPAERPHIWVAASEGLPNVTVIHEGNVVPWLLAADAVIHNGCTTGLEGHLLDRPVIAFRPFTYPGHELDLPNDVSMPASSIDEVVSTIRDILSGRHRFTPSDETVQKLHAHLTGLRGRLVSDRVLDVIDGMIESGEHRVAVPFGSCIRGYAGGALRSVSKALQSAMPFHKNSRRNRRYRFPGIELSEVEERISRLRRGLGRFEEVRVRALCRNVFEVYKG